jgi:hypothetical protein
MFGKGAEESQKTMKYGIDFTIYQPRRGKPRSRDRPIIVNKVKSRPIDQIPIIRTVEKRREDKLIVLPEI